MQAKKTWMLVADASKARLYAFHKARLFKEPLPKNLDLIGEFLHTKSRLKGLDLETDRKGLNGHGAFEETMPPKTHEADEFALQLSHHLENARKEETFEDIILIAPPSFMGLLQKHMTTEAQRLVSKKIEKDYTYQDEKEFLQNLLHYL